MAVALNKIINHIKEISNYDVLVNINEGLLKVGKPGFKNGHEYFQEYITFQLYPLLDLFMIMNTSKFYDYISHKIRIYQTKNDDWLRASKTESQNNSNRIKDKFKLK